MAGKIVETVQPTVERIVSEFGFELVEIEYIKKNSGYHLTIYIDKEGGVNIDDCERVHRALNEPLDQLDPTNGGTYILNVSSCGIDRPIKEQKDYLRALGKEVEIKLYSPMDGIKSFTGIIKEVEKDFVILSPINNSKLTQDINVEYKKIALCAPVIKF